ncbi:MAG: cell division protein FtsZ [bacterium]|nr:cell division protein FtsZ [bacterium]
MARKKQAKKIKLKKSVLPPSSLPVYTEGPLHKTKIRVIGIGGGGGFIVSEIISRVKKASFVVANTDLQALKKLDKRARLFQFGQKLTYGLGTGMNSELGKIAAQQEKEKIKKLLEGQDLCILVACLGGGTGSGAAPIFAKISRDLGNLTYGIFTLPFKFEGEKKAQIARESLKKIKPNLNAFSVIPNERIFQIIDKETPLRAALSVINKSLAESLEGLIEMIYDPGLINIDFADLKTIFEGRGRITYLNTVEVSGVDKSEEAIKKVVSNPLYPYTIRGAKGVLFNIAGDKNLGLNEISQISKTISDLANKEARIIFGISQLPFSSMGGGGRDKKYRDKIKITLLATGCGAKIFPPKPRKTLRRKIVKPEKTEEKDTLPLLETKKVEKKSLPSKQRMKTQKRTEIKPKKIEVKSPEPESSIQNSKVHPLTKNFGVGVKIRRNALQIKKGIEEAEQDLLNQERKWETPAFLRRKLAKNE